jgi:serine protease Do
MVKHWTKSLSAGLGIVVALLMITGARLEWPVSHATPPVYSEKASPPVVSPTAVADIKSLSTAFSALSDQVSPTVVNIYTTSGGIKQGPGGGALPEFPPGFEDELQRFFGPGQLPFGQLPQMKREALGSGFVINADEGYIVTNAHVVRMAGHNADEIMVKFIGEDNGKGHAAKIVGADEISDVALLKLTEKIPGLKAVALGDSAKTKVAEWVLAIGNPYGHTNTITQGIVSAIGRNLEGARSEFIQTSAGINPGNSGGPLINMNGEVIGINSAMDPRAQNIGFAIPINTAKKVIDQLVSSGHVKRAWIGVGIEDITEESAGYMRLKDQDGVLVKQVIAGAPAAKAGIERFDVIRKVNGQEVKNSRDLFKSLDQLAAGKTAEIEVLRSGKSTVVKVQLAEQPANS